MGQIIKKMEQRREQRRERMKSRQMGGRCQGWCRGGAGCGAAWCPAMGGGKWGRGCSFGGPACRGAGMGWGGGWAAPGWGHRQMMGGWGREPMPHRGFGPGSRGGWGHEDRSRGGWGPRGQGRMCPMTEDAPPRDIPRPRPDESPKSEWDWRKHKTANLNTKKSHLTAVHDTTGCTAVAF
jgi:hypothetical protein